MEHRAFGVAFVIRHVQSKLVEHVPWPEGALLTSPRERGVAVQQFAAEKNNGRLLKLVYSDFILKQTIEKHREGQ